MEYRLSESDSKPIRATARDVFLGLLLASGEMMVRVADPVLYPGHVEWMKRDQVDQANVIGAFSFIVKAGQVPGFFSTSELNRTPDWRLPDDQLRAALELLPLAADFRLY